MTSKDWPTPEEVQQALSQHGTSIEKTIVEAVMEMAWTLALQRRGSPQPDSVAAIREPGGGSA